MASRLPRERWPGQPAAHQAAQLGRTPAAADERDRAGAAPARLATEPVLVVQYVNVDAEGAPFTNEPGDP